MNNITPDLFPAGTRVKNTAGHTGTVNGWHKQSISVKWDEGGSSSFPGWHGGLSLLGSITCSACGTTKDDPALSWNTTTAFCNDCPTKPTIEPALCEADDGNPAAFAISIESTDATNAVAFVCTECAVEAVREPSLWADPFSLRSLSDEPFNKTGQPL